VHHHEQTGRKGGRKGNRPAAGRRQVPAGGGGRRAGGHVHGHQAAPRPAHQRQRHPGARVAGRRGRRRPARPGAPPGKRSVLAGALALLSAFSAAEPDCVRGCSLARAPHDPGVLSQGQKRSWRGLQRTRHDGLQRVGTARCGAPRASMMLAASRCSLTRLLTSHDCGPLQAAPSAHRGFLNRARSVPIESLYHLACRRGRRLVLTGALELAAAGGSCISLLWRVRAVHCMCLQSCGMCYVSIQSSTLSRVAAERLELRGKCSAVSRCFL